MSRSAVAFLVAALVAILAGSLADQPPAREPVLLGDYTVLAGDFHIHSGLAGDGWLTPWGVVLEAQRQRLDVIALTGHNKTWDGQVARWFSKVGGGPIVMVGEEITTSRQHVIALGIRTTVDWNQPVLAQIEAVHRQGGVAIAAHPDEGFAARLVAGGAVAALDGTEVCHPTVFTDGRARQNLERFATVSRLAPIGSSDFHLGGRIGLCRTYVFVRERTERGVVEAIRAGRTVVFGPEGRVYGRPEFVALAAQAPRLREEADPRDRAGVADWFSRVAGVAALGILAWIYASRQPSRSSTPRSSSDRASASSIES